MAESYINRKKLTKTQKKKAAAAKKLHPDLAFQHCKSLEEDTRSPSPWLHDDKSGRKCFLRGVPTLLQLCTAVVLKTFENSTVHLPKTIKHVLHQQKLSNMVKNSQLEWGMAILTALPHHTGWDQMFQKVGSSPAIIEFRPCGRALVVSSMEWPTQDELCPCCRCLPGLIWQPGTDLEDGLAQSVLSQVIDLLLPESLRDESAIITAKIRVKLFLLKRIPELELMFDHCMPYVWWSRGAFLLAESSFKNLIKTVQHPATRCYYGNELGRLYCWQGDRDAATRSYQIDDTARHTGRHSDIRRMALSANTWDQGCLSERTADHATSLWTTAYHMAPTEWKTHVALALMDSMLCFQGLLGSRETLLRVQQLNSQVPQILYHLSLLHALNGHSSDSQNTFADFVSKGYTSAYITDKRGADIHWFPWQPIINGQKGSQIKPMKLIWRTQLRSLCLSDTPTKAKSECDMRSEAWNFELLPNGCVTGALQMLCPDNKKPQLKIDTGQLQFVAQTSKYGLNTSAEHSLITGTHFSLNTTSCLRPPSLTTLYEYDGVRVQLLFDPMLDTGHGRRMELYRWQAGEYTTLQLVPLVNASLKELYLSLVEMSYEKRMNPERRGYKKDKRDHEQWRSLVSTLIKTYHANGTLPNYKFITKEAQHLIKCHKGHQRLECPECGKDGEYSKLRTQCSVTLTGYRGAGRTLVLFINDLLMMFIPVDSVEKFVETPKVVHVCQTGSTCSNLVPIVNCQKFMCMLPMAFRRSGFWQDRVVDYHGNCFACTQRFIGGTVYDYVAVFDAEGTVRDHDLDTHLNDAIVYCDVIGDTLYAINQSRDRLVCCHRLYSIMSRRGLYGHIHRVLRVTPHHLLLLSSIGLSLLDAKTLKPLKLASITRNSTEISEDKCWVITSESSLKIICSQEVSKMESDGVALLTKVAVVLGYDRLLILEIPLLGADRASDILFDMEMPGIPKEVCFISKTDGFLVTTRVAGLELRDLLLHMDYQGMIHRALPNLGPGDHSLTVLYVSSDLVERNSLRLEPGPYLVFRDQLGGVCMTSASLNGS